MKPLIGLNIDVNASNPAEARIARSYYEAVLACGGVPVLIPPMGTAALGRVLKQLDGLVFIGGRDYSSQLYGEEPSSLVNPLHPDRQEFDIRLMKRALTRRKLPILCICGGCQLLNIVLGGTLYYDIPSQLDGDHLPHKGEGSPATHPVSLKAGSRLAKIYRCLRLPSVVSSHHQSIRLPGRNLQVVAWAPDGIVEAVEHTGREFVLAVQWHPERDVAGNQALFRAFIKAAGNRRR